MGSPSYRAGAIVGAACAMALVVGSVVYFVLGGGSSDAACAAPVAEKIDPASSQHLLPDAPTPTYAKNPPTSGAHRPGIHPTGVLTKEIDPGVQVSMLEGGDVLLQYNQLTRSALTELRKLAGSHVTVAPNSAVPSGVVATAWLYRQECTQVDVDDLQTFIDAHVEKVHAH